jgi:hypothetical protein
VWQGQALAISARYGRNQALSKKGIDKTIVKKYVKYMNEGLQLMSKVPFKNPSTAATITALSAAVAALSRSLEESGPPELILMEGGKTDAN